MKHFKITLKWFKIRLYQYNLENKLDLLSQMSQAYFLDAFDIF